MAEHQPDISRFPPGWDCKYDTNTGKCYYINYLTKVSSLEDPRLKQRQSEMNSSNNDYVPLQPMNSSPYHVHPTNNYPAIQAFQGPSNNTAIYNMSSNNSPMFPSKMQQKIEMSSILRNNITDSPNSSRIIMGMMNKQQSAMQETSFSTPQEIDASVTKINNMFPTASENHIRLLLKKYYNREAVVISALQVEKHPLTTPGPFATPPPPGRHNMTTMGISSLMSMTPPMGRFDPQSKHSSPILRPGSSCAASAYGGYGSPKIGEGYRSSPKPHSSPKMKLRYLKSIFPKAEETLLLDILANADNNVQIASEKLLSMGYEKRDTTAPRLSNRKKEEQVLNDRRVIENAVKPIPKPKTNEEKEKTKAQLQALYKDVPGRIITMALESVDYSEDRACQILKIVMQDDSSTKIDKIEILKNDTVDNKCVPTSNVQSRSDSVASSSASSSLPLSSALHQQHLQSHLSHHDDSQSTLVIQDDIPAPSTSTTFHPTITLDTIKSSVSDETINYNSSAISSVLHSTQAMLQKSVTKRNRFKAKSDYTKTSIVTAEDKHITSSKSINKIVTGTKDEQQYKSVFQQIQYSGGPKSDLYKGPNEELLLVDYIAWNGANPDLCSGHKGIAVGPDLSLKASRSNLANGTNKDLYKGAQKDLAKGSIYAQINRPMANVKCN